MASADIPVTVSLAAEVDGSVSGAFQQVEGNVGGLKDAAQAASKATGDLADNLQQAAQPTSSLSGGTMDAVRALEAMNAASRETNASMAALGGEITGVGGLSFRAASRFYGLESSVAASTAEFRQALPTISQYEGIIRKADGAVGRFGTHFQSIRNQTTASTGSFKQIGSSTLEAAGGFERMGKALQAIDPKLDTIQAKGQQIASGFGQASLVFTGVAAGITAAGFATIKTAGQFEQLEARLEAVMGDANLARETFDRAVKRAAETPFNVEEVVKATVSLETFGISSEENLDRVLNLGAAFNDLDGASLAVSKALAGSLEGYESLRNTYSISTATLKRYGAEVQKTGGLMLQTQAQIDKAGNALKQIIDIKFGDATAKQAATIVGAFSNLEDSVINASAKFGAILAPAAEFVVRGLSSVVNTVGDMPEGFKTAALVAAGLTAAFAGVVGGGLALVAGLGLIGAATAGIVQGFSALQLAISAAPAAFQAVTAAGSATIAAIRGVSVTALAARVAVLQLNASLLIGAVQAAGFSGVMSALGGAIATALSTAAGGVATFGSAVAAVIGPTAVLAAGVGAVAAVVGGVTLLALRNAEKESKRLGDELDKLSAKAENTNRSFRDLATDLDKAFGVQTDFSNTAAASRKNLESLNEALKDKAPRDALNSLTALGRGVKDLEADLADARKGAQETGKRLQDLQSLAIAIDLGKDIGDLPAEQQALFKSLGSDVEVLRGELHSTEIQFNRLLTTGLQLDRLLAVVKPIATGFEAASAEATKFDAYLKYATKTDDVDELRGALDRVNSSLDGARKKFEEQAGAGEASTEKLLACLQDTKNLSDEEKAAIEDILDKQKERDGIEASITKQVKEAAKERSDALKAEFDDKAENISDDRKGNTERIALIKEYLTKVEAGSDAEKQLKRDLRQALKKDNDAISDDFKRSVDTRLETIRSGLDNEARTVRSNAATQATAIRTSIAALEAFGKANRAALESNPQAMEAYKNGLKALNDELTKTRDLKAEEAFEKLSKGLENAITKAESAPAKLIAIRAALDTLTTESKQVTTADQRKAVEAEIAQLKSQELAITKEIEASEKALAGEVSALRRAALEDEIRLLEARQAAGEGVENALKLKRDELHAARLKEIDVEKDAALKANQILLDAAEKKGDKVAVDKLEAQEDLINERAKLKKQGIEADVTLSKYQEKQKQVADAKTAADKEVSIESDKQRRITKEASAGKADHDKSNASEAFGITPFNTSSFGGFFDTFGSNTRTIDRTRPTFKTTQAAGATPTPSGINATLLDVVRKQGPITGPLTEEQLQQRLDAYQANATASLERTRAANIRSNNSARLYEPSGQGKQGSNSAQGGSGPPTQTINVNLGDQKINVSGGGAKLIRDTIQRETGYSSIYDGSGR